MQSLARRLLSNLWGKLGLRKEPSFQSTWSNLKDMLALPPLLRLKEADGEFFIDPRSDNFARLIAFGSYEPKLIELTRSYLRKDGDALDIGANIGIFTTVMSRGCPDGRVLACEPTNNALRLLRQNIDHNGLKNTIVFPGVVSSTNGYCDLSYVDGKEEYSSINGISHEKVRGLQRNTIRVPSQTVDSLVEEHGLKPCVIKIDVEGSESNVFMGAASTLKKFRPAIFSELSERLLVDKGSSKREAVKILESFGYRVTVPGFESVNPMDPKYEEIMALPLS